MYTIGLYTAVIADGVVVEGKLADWTFHICKDKHEMSVREFFTKSNCFERIYNISPINRC